MFAEKSDNNKRNIRMLTVTVSIMPQLHSTTGASACIVAVLPRPLARCLRALALATLSVVALLVLTIAGCISLPPDVLRELDPPAPGQPNNFPSPTDSRETSAR